MPGGWITFPGGQFDRDPASLPGRLVTHVPSYDRAAGTWVPVEYENVAPDGGSYILHGEPSTGNPTHFYLVDVKNGNRRLIPSADGPPQASASWQVIAYASEGVYLWSVGIATVPGLWLLDPQTGGVRLIDGSQYWSMVANGAAWAQDPRWGYYGFHNTVYRLDLQSGQVSTWYETETAIRLLSPSPEGDMLVIYREGDSARLELLTGPNRLLPLAVAPDFPQVADAYLTHPGVWLSLRGGGIALYVKGEGVRIMIRSPDIFNVAGGCW